MLHERSLCRSAVLQALTIVATAIDSYSLYHCEYSGCKVPWNGSWHAAPEVLWVCAQVILQVVHFPVRLIILQRVQQCRALFEPAALAAALADLSRSTPWAINKFLGSLHAVWFIAGLCCYYWTVTYSSNTCPLRRLLLVHTCVFVVRCFFTFIWYARVAQPAATLPAPSD